MHGGPHKLVDCPVALIRAVRCSNRCLQRLTPLHHHSSPSPDQPVDTHYRLCSPDFPSALLELSHPFARQRRPHLPQLQPQRPRSSNSAPAAGAAGMQRCQRQPCHHSGPHREQHMSERAVGRQSGWTPHPPDPRQRATHCLKAVRRHQPADTQSLWSVIHGHELKVRLC